MSSELSRDGGPVSLVPCCVPRSPNKVCTQQRLKK